MTNALFPDTPRKKVVLTPEEKAERKTRHQVALDKLNEIKLTALLEDRVPEPIFNICGWCGDKVPEDNYFAGGKCEMCGCD
ncbi:hypothetical protein [Vibrio splendidus]|uniref:hypothetical protein n=1 Tax=Vibrio splendidus TaxID=29497 RepID=UPI000D393EFB|nr:hypothetical protein [Vibrio splendidus]PTP95465.1 hypothetical protein CWO02_01080 [Vibrio splendidus]